MGTCILPAGELHFAKVCLLNYGWLIIIVKYYNGKAAYVENIWKVINWATAEERFKGDREDAFKILKAAL